MTGAMSQISERVATLRHEFDAGFGRPPAADAVAMVDLLAIRLGPQEFALRLSEIAGLHAGKTIAPVPGGGIALLGIAGFRGAIVPVYDLRKLVTHSASDHARWLVVAADVPIAFAFDGFERQLRVPADRITLQHTQAREHHCTKDFVQIDSVLCPIVHLPSVVGSIKS